VSFDNWEAHAHLDPVVPGDGPAQIFYGPEWASPQKSTRREKQLVRRLAAERKSTPGSIRTELQVQVPGGNMAKHAVALKSTVRRARKGLHLRQAPYEAMHSAAETPSSSPGAFNVLAYYPVVNAEVTDSADRRGRFGMLVEIEGALARMLGRRDGVAIDAAVSPLTTGLMVKPIVAGIPVPPTTGAFVGVQPAPVVTDARNRRMMLGTQPHHRSEVLAVMMTNVEVHDFDAMMLMLVMTNIPCDKPGCLHPTTIHKYPENPEGWFRQKSDCFRPVQLANIISISTDLSSVQLKAIYGLSRYLLDLAYHAFTGSGRQWELYVTLNKLQPVACTFHCSKAWIGWLFKEVSKQAPVIYALDMAWRSLCRGPRNNTEIFQYVTAFNMAVTAIIGKSDIPGPKKAAASKKIIEHIHAKRLADYGAPNARDNSRRETYLDCGRAREPSQREKDRAAQLPMVDDPALSWLDDVEAKETAAPLVPMMTTNPVEQVRHLFASYFDPTLDVLLPRTPGAPGTEQSAIAVLPWSFDLRCSRLCTGRGSANPMTTCRPLRHAP